MSHIIDRAAQDSSEIVDRARQLFQQAEHKLHVRTDRMFASLMVLQWLGGIAAAALVSPRAWPGSASWINIHVCVAVFLGGAISGLPIGLALLRPGTALARQVFAIAQMLSAALLIHLTGGHIESHFQIFGSLAFLAFYRDWRVLVTATIIVAVDHLLRGALWPQSLLGVLTKTSWRWLETVGWVMFENAFLWLAIRQNRAEMRGVAHRRAELEATNACIEEKVVRRTAQLTAEVARRQHQEAELEKAYAEARESVRLKAAFLATMSHEIRTPMNGIIGMTGLLLDTELTAQQREFTEIIRSSGDALLTIINDILDFSKIEAGKLNLELLNFDLRATVEGVVEMLAEQANSKKIELIALVQPGVPAMLRGDPGRLRQILINLIGNALKFTNEGEVMVHVYLESETDQEAVVRFVVQDTGIGISKECSKNLFQSFSQADGSTTRKYGGTGLGLAICKRLVELMNGAIGVISTPGVGSTFHFSVRFGKCAGLEQPISELDPNDLCGDYVVVVDDNETTRMALQLQLDSWGIQNDAACNAEGALAILRRQRDALRPVDVILLDSEMPVCDGWELARRIRSDESLNHTRIIMMASSSAPGERETKLRATGVRICLSKPVKQSKLYDALVTLLLDRRTGQASVSGHAPVAVPGGGEQVAPAPRRAAHVLVAEDNIINQKVILRQLAKLGFRADAVANGLEALSALESIPYDVVLMDCQMPEMDGYTATQELRRRHKGRSPVYVIALTANSMEGDRDKCLAAGMDDYLSKPLKVSDLEAKLLKWQPHSRPAVAERSSNTNPPIALGDVLNRIDGDRALLREMIELYLEEGNARVELLRSAVAIGETAEIGRIAHNLVGASLTCGMTDIVRSLRKLERLAQQGQLAGCDTLLSEVQSQLSRIQAYFQTC